MESQERRPDPDLIDEEEDQALEPIPDDDLVREQEAAAAAEAARIGGEGGADEIEDDTERPLAEAGEGESEGFELAEQDLIDHATGDLDAPNPLEEAGEVEAEWSDAEYGEPDEIESTETEEDSAGPQR
jgi:hypothetical protein